MDGNILINTYFKFFLPIKKKKKTEMKRKSAKLELYIYVSLIGTLRL